MGETPENWTYHSDGSPYPCELCDLSPYECQCPNGPWRDVDEGIQWLLGEHNVLTVEIEQLQNDKALLDYLEAEAEHDHARAIFRRNMPITRETIGAATDEYPQTTKNSGGAMTNPPGGAYDVSGHRQPKLCCVCGNSLTGEKNE